MTTPFSKVRESAGRGDRPVYRVSAERDGRFWFLRVAGRPELFTQVVRLEAAAAMVRDLVATFDQVDPESFGVVVEPLAPEPVRELVDEALEAKLTAEGAQEKASGAMRRAAAALLGAGLTVRDAGVLLGVSHQRIAQLVDER